MDEKSLLKRSTPSWPAAMITALAVVVHASLLLLPPINFEHSFADAAQYFLVGQPELLSEYFSVQANTVGMPFLAAQVSRVLPSVPLLQVLRIVVLLGLPLLALAIQRICAALGRTDAHLVTAYVLLNPLVWIYAGRATADFFPMALGVWAISLLLQSPVSVRRAMFGGLVLGCAAVLKYHAAFLALVVAAYHLRGTPRTWPLRPAAAFLIATAAPLLVYLTMAHAAFGFWLTPPEFQAKHQFTLGGFASNFVCYAGYLVLLAMPTLPILPTVARSLANHWRSVLLTLGAMAVVGYFGIVDNGEMNLGPADRWVPSGLRTAIFAAVATGLILPLWLRPRELGRFSTALWWAIVAILVVFSMTRPAQRYLLFVIPFLIALLPRQLFAQRMLAAVLTLFMMSNAFVEYNRACTGIAAADLMSKVVALNLADSTDLGAINGHVGLYVNHIPPTRRDYVIVKGEATNAVAVARAGWQRLPVTFSLIRTESVAAGAASGP
ncbi:hypothetical protein ACFJGW_10080 [Burkholderiaceae bacterium UC74_6]